MFSIVRDHSNGTLIRVDGEEDAMCARQARERLPLDAQVAALTDVFRRETNRINGTRGTTQLFMGAGETLVELW